MDVRAWSPRKTRWPRFTAWTCTRTSSRTRPGCREAAARSIRIVEGLAPRRARKPLLAPRRILAEVPIEADGSFQVKLPADTPIELQLLDDRGISLRECGWIWARGHQAQGCIGCHEDPERTPPNLVPLALQKPGVAAYPAGRGASCRSISCTMWRPWPPASAAAVTATAGRAAEPATWRDRRQLWREDARAFEKLAERGRAWASSYKPAGLASVRAEHGEALGRRRS